MRRTAIGWVVLLSIVLLSSQMALGQEKIAKPLDYAGGMDEMDVWTLTDENLVPLIEGDIVMAIWTGPNGAIEPPVSAQGSPYNGRPTGDDVALSVSGEPYGEIDEYSEYYFSVSSWNVGDVDSLGRQRHPVPGELVYARVFNSNDLTTATYYGDSNLYEVIGSFGELFYAQLHNDPTGPTTNEPISGRFFKIVGGIDPVTGIDYPIKDADQNQLEDGDLVQLIWVGEDGNIDLPAPGTFQPGGDDSLITQWGVNEGFYPSTGTGLFRKFSASFDLAENGLPAQDQQVYVRLFNDANALAATYYGDSAPYQVQYVVGESLSVFDDDAVDCDTPVATDRKNLTIFGGWDPIIVTGVPIVDIYGLRLKDDDKVQIIWAGPDGLVDPVDKATGEPTGDDSLYIDGAIGEGIAGIGLGRFEYDIFTYETHTKGGFPAQGDIFYARVFDDPTIGYDSGSRWYGESMLDTVEWIYDEEFYFFPDTLFDAVFPTDWYRTLKIYAGTDTAQAEYPLTDSSGTKLSDGDLVQLIWAGADGMVDPLDLTSCMPTGDDSLWATFAIGDGYGSNTGLFKTEVQTFKTLHPGEGDVLYLRVFNGDVYTDATHYGESEAHTVAYLQGETFRAFDDEALDCVISNPCFTSVEEWADPSVSMPTSYVLYQNFPNPFNPETDICYQIPDAGYVRLVVYNVIGQEICTLVNGHRSAGTYTVRWFGTNNMGHSLSSGIYFYRLQAGDFTDTRKMVLMK